MKKHILHLMAVLVIVSLFAFPTPAKAVAYGTQFSTAVTYMNVGSQPADITFQFYAEGASSVTQSYAVAQLAPSAAASLSVGTVFTTTFKGSAIMVSSQPLVATMVQLPQGATTVKNRPLANGQTSGASPILAATILKNKFSANSILSVQNAGSVSADVTVNFIATTDGTNYNPPVFSLSPGAARYFDMGTISNVGTVFNGSARISSTAPLVATVLELSTNKDVVYAYEGVSGGATTLYMPSALCNFSGQKQTSYYAIQNTSTTTNTEITTRFTGVAAGVPVDVTLDSVTILPGAKAPTVSGCGDASNVLPNNFIGSAVITSDSQPIIGIGKVAGTGVFATAHEGTASGSRWLALPYVRYTDNWWAYNSNPNVQRTFIAVQNIGGSTLAAGSVQVEFVGPTGAVLGTYTNPTDLAPGEKFSFSPKNAGLSEFGYVPNATTGKPVSYGGGAIVTGPVSSSLVALARVSSNTVAGDVAEDYNGIPFTPAP
jgi:hypothetical protein